MALQTADVNKLNCLFYSLVRDVVQVEWYGIKCNVEDKKDLIDKIKALRYLYNNCSSYDVECRLLDIIKKSYNSCKLTLETCESRITRTGDES